MADILILVIVADAAQNGMSGECEVDQAFMEPDGQVTVLKKNP